MGYNDKIVQLEYQKNWIAARRTEYLSKHGGCCSKCQSLHDLEFHHRDRTQKIDHKIWSWQRVRIDIELAKCDLLCRFCHAEETAKERGYGTRPHGTLTSYQNYRCRCTKCRAANAVYEHNRRLKLSMV